MISDYDRARMKRAVDGAPPLTGEQRALLIRVLRPQELLARIAAETKAAESDQKRAA